MSNTSSIKINKESSDHFSKWHLSTEGFYFKYRSDKHDKEIMRADLYYISRKKDLFIANVRVSGGYGISGKSHHDIINYFEVLVMPLQSWAKNEKGHYICCKEKPMPNNFHNIGRWEHDDVHETDWDSEWTIEYVCHSCHHTWKSEMPD